MIKQNEPVHHFQIQGFETSPHWDSAEFLHPGMLLGTLLIQELESKLGPVHILKKWKHISEPLALEMAIIHWCSSAKLVRFLYGPLVVWKWQWKSRWHFYINTSLFDCNMFQLRSNQDQKTFVIVCVIPIGSPSPPVCKFECSNSSK